MVSTRKRQKIVKTCVVCGKDFEATRSDAMTCSKSCRQRLQRIRATKRKEIERQTLSADQLKFLIDLEAFNKPAAQLLRRMYAFYGKDVAVEGMAAVSLIWNECYQRYQPQKHAGEIPSADG